MPLPRRTAVAAGLAAPTLGQAQAEAPLRLVVPFPPGGAVDLLARALEPALTRELGRTVLVENRAGGNTLIGTDHVAKAPADGARLVFVQNSFTANAALHRNPPFDARRDFVGVAFLAYNPILLIASAASGLRDLRAALEAARAAPGRLAYASFGNGSASHLAGEQFKRAAGVNLLHVPYQGGAPALRDVAGGHVPLMFANLPSALPILREGRAVALGVADTARSPLAPEVPTFEEGGVAGAVAWAWFGLAARSGTPEEALDRLNLAVNRALSEPAMIERLMGQGLMPRVLTRAAFQAHLERAFEADARLVREAGITVD